MNASNHLIKTALSRRTLLAAGGALGLLSTSGAAFAQTPWPTRPVRLVVGFAAGGSTDAMARALAQSLTEVLGQPFVVENRPGASGNLSVGEVSRARADGYTIMVAPTSVQTANPHLFTRAGVQPARDLTPVMGIARTQMYVIARPTLQAEGIRDLIALARAQPGRVSYGSAGIGTPPHLGVELFQRSAGISFNHIPFRGSAPALQAVMSGEVDFAFDPGIAFPHIQAGRVKLLGVASDQKSPFTPNAPTFADLGIRNASLDIWFGVWAPNNLPAHITERLSQALTRSLAAPALKERFQALGAEPTPLPTAAFRTLLADEERALSSLIRERNIVVE